VGVTARQKSSDSALGINKLIISTFAVLFATTLPAAPVADPDGVFRESNELARRGDLPKAIAGFNRLSTSGTESASLYWNWAQAARALGRHGEALWALIRARELESGDPAIAREIERTRAALNLDPAELSPEPLALLGRLGRRFLLDIVAATLIVISLVFHGLQRLTEKPGLAALAWTAFLLGGVAAAFPAVGSFARPTGVVLRRNAPLLDSASPMAESIGALREGEVVPILDRSSEYIRVQDSSGARGWAHVDDVRGL
jgi:hypothetical protein